MSDARARILPPYTRRVDDWRHLSVKLVLSVALVSLAMILGFAIALFGLQGWFIPLVPISIMFLVALWMAPDMDTHLDRAIGKALFVFAAFTLMWPNYIAMNIPGLPWISFERLTVFVAFIIFAYAFATSSRVRDEVVEVVTSNKWLFRFFLTWNFILTAMVFVAQFETFSRYIHYLIAWNSLFVMTAWIMRKEGNPELMFKLMVFASAVTSIVVLPEFRFSKPIWADHIPAFFAIDPDIVQRIQFGRAREEVYRAKSIFQVSVTYAEFVGMCVPIVIFSLVHAKSSTRAFFAAALLVLLFSAAVLTQSRTAMVGIIVTVPLFLLMWTVRRYRKEAGNRDIVAPALVWSFPAISATILLAVLLIPRLRVRVFGGGTHAASNNAREAQWEMAIPQIAKNPFGYGVDKVSDVVPYTNLAGDFTIDSYPINLLIDYGVIGFAAFIGFFLMAAYLGARAYVMAESRNEMVAGPMAISIISFLVSRLVLSSEGSQDVAFLMAGVIAAVHWRQSLRVPRRSPVPIVTPRFVLPPRAGIGRAGRSA